MKTLLKIGVVLLLLGAGGVFAFPKMQAYWKERNKPSFRQSEVTRGEIVLVINSTGTVQPVLRVQIGSFVSGPITELCVDHNDPVKKGQLMARVDPWIYEAVADRDRAALATREAEVDRAKAQLQQAQNDEQRAKDLKERNSDYISETEMDRVRFNTQSLMAQLRVAEASVDQAKASLKNSMANLSYAEITSPVDGIVIERKIDEGQTLAAQFQTPELFVVAPNMREKMHVFASVDEADIGLIREAHEQDQQVHFTVDAYPEDLFEGTIYQVRMNPTTVQNVVTYPVVVEAPNPDLKLMPGMTANLSFQIDKREEVLKVPNAALRFYPSKVHVRPEDQELLEGKEEELDQDDDDSLTSGQRSAIETAQANRKRNRKHVWVVEGDLLRAVEVAVGLSDYKFTEVVSGELEEGQKVVTGIEKP